MSAPAAISTRTRLYGLLGDPVSHSLSPAMHNAAFAAAGIDGRYLAFHVRRGELPAALRGLSALGAGGVNLTLPHKEQAVRLVDELTPRARSIGAVNTLLFPEPGRLIGDNTDAPGLTRDLAEHGVELAGRRVLLLGAGGAARSVAFGLLAAGLSELYVLNRDGGRARRLAEDAARPFPDCQVRAQPADAPWPDPEAFDLVVNATRLGLGGQGDPWREGLPFPSEAVAYDLIYGAATTPFLARAQRAGARAISGLGMLVWQGALAWEAWTGEVAPAEVMRAAALAELAG